MICPNCHKTTTTLSECEHCKSDLTSELRRIWETYNYSPVQCPVCGKITDSLKVYTLPSFWLFIGFYLRYSTKGHMACPSCMRKKILLHGFTYNIITANLFWIIAILPWSLINMLRTLSKGHSWKVVENMDTINKERH